MRQVVIYPGQDGCWVVECPSLPGCVSQGKTREEAVQNIREAIRGYIGLRRGPLPFRREGDAIRCTLDLDVTDFVVVER